MAQDTLPLCASCGTLPRRRGGGRQCYPCRNAERRAKSLRLAEANPAQCAECGGSYVKLTRALTCSPECRKRNVSRQRGLVPAELTVCAGDRCARTFMPARTGAKFCSDPCRDRAKHFRYKNDPEYVARRREVSTRHYHENRDSILARGAKWREANRERHRAASRDWWERNRYSSPSWRTKYPEKHAAKQRVRTTRLRNLTPVPIRHEDVIAKAEYWGNKCWICAGPFAKPSTTSNRSHAAG